jgi:hypothetical protein
MDFIQPKHLEGDAKIIGTIGSEKLLQLKTKGGLYVVAKKKPKGYEILAFGPHRAAARNIVQKRYDDVCFTELSKSDHVPEEQFAMILPQYEALTDAIRKLNGDD